MFWEGADRWLDRQIEKGVEYNRDGGFETLGKAFVNSAFRQVQGKISLGFWSEKRRYDIFDVTDQDRSNGYNDITGFVRGVDSVTSMTNPLGNIRGAYHAVTDPKSIEATVHKARANALAETGQSLFTFGLLDEKHFLRMEVTDQDRANGYGGMNLGARIASEVGLMVLTGGGSAALKAAGWGGKAIRFLTRVEATRNLATATKGAGGIAYSLATTGEVKGEDVLHTLAYFGFKGNLKALKNSGQMTWFERVGSKVEAGVFKAVNTPLSMAIHNKLMRAIRLEKPAATVFNKMGFQVCFAAGTPIRTPAGHKRIEEIRAGDWVMSRDEHNPDSAVMAQQVEEVFVRFGETWELRVRGRSIKTTSEHPFYVEGRGWTPASALKPGERLLGEQGDWLEVEEIANSGRSEVVYNFRVANWHTYFMGESTGALQFGCIIQRQEFAKNNFIFLKPSNLV